MDVTVGVLGRAGRGLGEGLVSEGGVGAAFLPGNTCKEEDPQSVICMSGDL